MWESSVCYQMVCDLLINTCYASQVWMVCAAEACLVDPSLLVVKDRVSNAVTIWMDWARIGMYTSGYALRSKSHTALRKLWCW
jgi:hypothetical protein